jgi:predicted dehydrogenase
LISPTNELNFHPSRKKIYPAHSPALNFIDVILGKAANGSPGDLGLASMEIIEAACESARTNRREKIRPVKNVHADKPAAVRENA